MPPNGGQVHTPAVAMPQSRPNLRQVVINRLQNTYGFTTRGGSKGRSSNAKVIPAEPRSASRRDEKPQEMKLPSEIQRFWDWWLHECHDTNDSLRNRMERISDLDYMRYNDGVINMAIELYADEATQNDSQSEVLRVSAPNPEVEKYIRDKFIQWGYDQNMIRAFAEDVAQYGEAFTINSTIPGEGIIDVTHVDPRVIKDRIEFRASDVNIEFISSAGLSFNNISRMSRLNALQDVISEVGSSWSKYFKTFLFGFQLENDIFLPPWNVSHFRNFSTKKEIYPWGKSPFIYSISLFRQLKAAKNLMAIARAMSLPREIFEVTVDGDMTWEERWEVVNEAREEYQNISDLSKTKEELTVGSQFWTIKDALTFEWKSAEVNIDSIKDIEVLRDDEIISTKVPKGYLIVDRANFGTSGQALLQQFKPFGHAVFNIQSILLREISNQIRLDMMIADKFEKELTEFDLSMNFPVVEEARDRTQAKADSFHFAVDVVNGVKDLLGVDGPMPTDVVRSVLSKLSFLSMDEIDSWVVEIAKQGVPDNPTDEEAGKLVEDYRKIHDAARSRLNENTVKIAEFEIIKKMNSIGEYVKNSRHHVFNAKEMQGGSPYDRSIPKIYRAMTKTEKDSRDLLEFVASETTSVVEIFNKSATLMENKSRLLKNIENNPDTDDIN
jgi:hypothetical protein